MIKPYKETPCLDCIEAGDSSIKPTIAKRCFLGAPWHYQKHQQAKSKAKAKVAVKGANKPIRKVSEKMANQLRVYSKLRVEFINQHPNCEARLRGCTGLAGEVHHKAGRSGKLLNDTSKWLAVCRSCHDYITEFSNEAIRLGLSESRIAS